MAKFTSVGLFCGSSAGADPKRLVLAQAFGRRAAERGLRLVYGGGGIGLMGAAARAAHQAGGDVLGVIPDFLQRAEIVYGDVAHVVVASLHERKRIMTDEAQGFVILPGGVGTLEEVVELLSWAQLGLHAKPAVFLDEDGFWDPFFALVDHQIEEGFAPPDAALLMDRARTPDEALDLVEQKVRERG